MNSRLSEIQNARNSSLQSSTESYSASDMEEGRGRELKQPLLMDGPERSEHAAFLQEFFSRVEDVKEGISFVDRSAAEVLRIKEGGGGRGASDGTRLATVVMRANKRALLCKDELKLMRRELAEIKEDIERLAEEKKKGGKGGSSKKRKTDPKVMRTLRVRQNVVQALMRKFVETVNKYQKSQHECKAKMEENTLRQVAVVSPNSTREVSERLGKREEQKTNTVLTP